MEDEGRWEVRSRVERFVEAAVLLLLREESRHGYDLASALGEFVGDESVDIGNLYRLLRSLEREGLVVSEWTTASSGRPTRAYQLTEEGSRVLDRWVESVKETRERLNTFLDRYQNAG